MNTRRRFIKEITMIGAAAFCLSPTDIFATPLPKRQKPKASDGAVVLFQGDSITDGNRGRNTDPNHIMSHGYAFSIASRVGADYPEKKYQFYNRGISGNKLNDLEKRWQAETLDLKPAVLSILVGVNDSSSVVFKREPIITPEKYEEIYAMLLEQTKAAFPKILFVLCEPFILPVGRIQENWLIFAE